MKKFKFSSRVLAFVLAFVMIASLFPLSALAAVNQFDIVTEDKYVGTGIDNDTLNKDDAINWPIKVYDHLADGMLFEFAQNQSSTLYTSSEGSVSNDTYGGQYVLGQPMPYAPYGTDYTTDQAYNDYSYTTQYGADGIGTRYSRTPVAAVNYQCPRFLRLYLTKTYSGTSGRNYPISHFDEEDVSGGLACSTVRYMVIVYRSSGISGTDAFQIGTQLYNSSYWRESYSLPNSSEWTYKIIDLKTVNSSIGDSTKIGEVYVTVNVNNTSWRLDISQVGYFSSQTAAETYAQQCLTFNNEPGEYIQGTRWNGANNTGFGMLHPSNGAQWTNTTAGGSPSTATGKGFESTGYYTHRIGYWISTSTNATASNNNRKTGKDSDGRFNGSGSVQGENGIYYINATGYASDAGTETYDMSKLNFGGYNLLTEGIKGVWTAGLLQNTLGKDGTPQYKQETVEYIADMLSKTLVIPQYAKADPSSGYANYNYVAGVKNRAQFGYTEVNGTQVDNDLAQGLRNCLGISFTKGQWKGNTPTMGTYADTLAKADKLKGAFLSCSDNIKTCMDAAYYLLHNTFVADSYNQLQDDFTYLTLSSAKLDNGEQAYVFDGGFSQGAEIEDVISGKITQAQYKDRTQSAVEYSGYNQPNGTGTISLGTVNEKDYFYYAANEASVTTKFPFLPVVEAEGVYAGQTDSYYFAEDGKRSFTLDNDTYYGRNYGYTLVSNGEFVYQENENLYFEFEGDDDVYLFINGQLVLDLGGGHSVSSCRFNVNDYVEWAKTVLNNPTNYSATQVARANALNLEDGEIASFDFYYMERHGYGANMRILTNMHITDPALRVQKQAYQGGKEIDYGGIVDGATPIAYKFTTTNGGNTKLYNFTFDDADIGVSLSPENGLYVAKDNDGDDNNDINGYIVTDARLGKLEAQDLIAVVKGYKDVGTGGNYDYDFATDSYNKVEAGTGKYEYVVTDDITFADNEALKAFLKTLESDATDNTTVDDEQTRRGSGLWVDATLEISGIYYTMTHDQVESGSFNNTVYVTATNKADRNAPGCETKRSDDSHRVYITAIPAYYQWEDNELFVPEKTIFADATKEAGNENSLLNEYIDFFTAVNKKAEELGEPVTECIRTAFCDKNGVKGTKYDFVKDSHDAAGNYGFIANYDTTGIHEFYVLMYKDSEVFNETVTGVVDTMEEGQYAIVRVLIIVADTEDATYVLDYGLKTENLDVNGELFKNDDLLGKLSGTDAKLMGISSTGGEYLKVSDGTNDYNRIDFDAMELDDHNNIYVNGKDGKADGFYTFNMKIDEKGKEITYNEFSGMYSLTDSGTTLVHAQVPYTWEQLYLYYWYDDGSNNTWPGEPMNKTSHGNFNLSIPGNVPHIIISNGEAQSVDLTINPGEEVWIDFGDGSEMSGDKLLPSIEYKSRDGIIHADVPDDWGDVYIYCWDMFSHAVEEWPGTKIEAVDEDGYYTLTIPGDITNVIVNNGKEGVTEYRKQTEDLTVTAGEETWILVNDTPIEDTADPERYTAVATQSLEKVTMHATVPELWNEAWLYYWNSNGSYTGVVWPGIQMTKDETTGVYSLEVPADVENVIISDGTFRQTENLSVTAGLETWINVEVLSSTATAQAAKPDDWDNVYFYFFKEGYDGTIDQEWPGRKGRDYEGTGIYSTAVPPYATHVVINNGKVGDEAYLNQKTKDLALSAEWTNNFIIEGGGETVVLAHVPDWWFDVCVHYWNENTSESTQWPGVPVTVADDRTVSFLPPEGTTHVIINGRHNPESEDRQQTNNITLAQSYITKININDNYNESVETVVHASGNSKVTPPATTTKATVTYGIDAENEGFSFTPVDFMDTEYNLWMALTVHEKDIDPTVLGKAIDIGKEVQMMKKVTVLPASVVYYEDIFEGINYADKNSTSNIINHYTSGTGSLTQSIDQNQQYGNDKTYQGSENDELTGGSFTEVYINDNNEFASFSFTGTGFEIIGHTHATGSGTLMVELYDENNNFIKKLPVITEFDNGGDGGSESIVSVPIVRMSGLEYGTYKVVLKGVPVFDFDNWTDFNQAPPVAESFLCIDGVRIYQPISDSAQVVERHNIALNKTYTGAEVALAGSLNNYYYDAKLTDGIAADFIDAPTWATGREGWFGYHRTLNVENTADNVPYGQLTIDLGDVYSLDEFKVHLGSKDFGTAAFVDVYVSSDGTNWSNYVGSPSDLNPDATSAYWATLKLNEAVEGRYVRMCFGFNTGIYWVMLNEVEIYGEKSIKGSGVHDAYIDNENGATYTEVRDLIENRKAFAIKYDDKNGLSVSGGTNTWIENRNNVLPNDHNTKWTNNTVASVADYLIAGPNNEVYMIESTDVEKSAVAFYVKETGAENTTMQIAFRAVDYGSFIGSSNTGKINAEIQYGAVGEGGELVWRTLAASVSSAEQYYTIPYTECPYDEALDRYQVVLRVADTDPTGMASFTSLKYNGLELLTLNESEVPDVSYGEDLGNTLLDSNGNTLSSSDFVSFIELVDQMTGATEPAQGAADDTTTPAITGNSTSSMGVLYDSFTANTSDFAITDDSKIFIVTASEDTAPEQDIIDTAQLVQQQFAADGYDMQVVWGIEKYATKGDIIVYTGSAYSSNGDEGYTLTVTDRAKIECVDERGLLYGLNTLQKHFRAANKNAIKGFTLKDEPDTIERTLHLDVARKYLTVEAIKNYIAEISWMGYNAIELHMAEDGGFRMDFWGDKALAEVPGMTGNDFSWVCGSNPAPWVFTKFQDSNGKVNDKGKYLTTEEVIEICETAKEYNIEIIPSFDTPAHVGYMTELYYNTVKANSNSPIRNFTYKGTNYTLPTQINYREYTGSTDTRYDFSVLDLSNTAVKNFAYAMYNDIAAFFKYYSGSDDFNIGADEVGLKSTDRWNYNTHFVNYVNDVNNVLKSYGYKTRMYNDFLYNTNYSSITTGISNDIGVVYWLPTTSSRNYLRTASFYANQGRQVYSGVNFWTYYVLRIAPYNSTNTGTHLDARDPSNRQWEFYRNQEDHIYNEWNASQFGAYTDTNLGAANNYSGDKLAGAYLMIWNDFAGLNTEVEVWNGCYDEYGKTNSSESSYSGYGYYYSMIERMWSSGIKQWNADINSTLTFANFEPLRDEMGFFPGYVATPSTQAYANGMNLPEKQEVEGQYRTYYDVKFVNYDGTVLQTVSVKEGNSATYTGATPEKPVDVWYTYTFNGWDKELENITGNMTVIAQYEKSATIAGQIGYLELKSAGGSNIQMSVDNGTSKPVGLYYVNSSMDFGKFVTVKAVTNNDYEFIGWVNAKTGEIVSINPTYSFYTSGNDVLVAMYAADHNEGKSLVTFRNDKTNQIIDMQYYNMDNLGELVFPAVVDYPGYEHVGWDRTDAQILEALQKGENITITTKWAAKTVYFKVTVNGGSVTNFVSGGVDDMYRAYKATTVTADKAPSGKKFAYWQDEKGRIVSYSEAYKFYPHKNTELTAVFVGTNEAVNGSVISTVDIDTTTLGDANTAFFSWDTSSVGYEIVNTGVLLVEKQHYFETTFGVGTIDPNVYQFVPAMNHSNSKTGSYSVTIPSVSEGDTWVAKSFVQYRDAQGVIRVVYSDLIEATK